MSSNSSSDDVYRWYADMIVYRVFGPLIACLGLVGGTLSLLVFRRPSLKKKSCSIYFFFLALADVLCMTCWLVHFVLPTYNIHLLTLSHFSCKIFVFSMYFAFDLANYILTVCSMDRAASVLFPLESRRFCSRSMAYSITLILVLILTLFNSHFFYGFVVVRVKSLSSVDPLSICHHRMDSKFYRQFFSVYDSYVDVMKTNVVPFVIMSICNLIIIVRVCRSNSSLINSQNNNGENRSRSIKSKRKHDKDRQLTLMLVGSAMAFLILTLPTEINDIIRSHSPGHLVSEKSYLLSSILLSLAHLNYAVHFYIYTLTGELFRQQLIQLWPIRLICPWFDRSFRCAKRAASTSPLEGETKNGRRHLNRMRHPQLDLSLVTSRINDDNDSLTI